MPLLHLILIILFLIPSVSYGQSYSQQLTQGLVDLKNSVEQLSSGNQVLALKNTQLKDQVMGRQLQLQKIMEENQKLNEVSLKLQEINSTRTQEIKRLEEDISILDKELNTWVSQHKEIQDRLEQLQKDRDSLDNQMSQLANPATVIKKEEELSPEMSQEWHQKQKEKMAILKLIVESQNKQDLLLTQIHDFQKDLPSQEVAMRAKEGYKLRLEEKIQQLQDEIALLNSSSAIASKGWDQEQIRQLQVNIDNLEKNKEELQVLVLKMRQKTQQMTSTSSQKHEQVKLQANIERLKDEAKGLRFDLEELQRQMVGLDKRKAYLETLLQK